MAEHDGLGGNKYTALYLAQVVDVADPEKLGRVKVTIPGLIEPASGWAFPSGLPGGGGPNRGVYVVPPLHATVHVWFHQGDIDHPYYLAGHYGLPAGQRETPGPVGGYMGTGDADLSGVSPEDAVKVPAWEGDRFVVWADERTGHERFVIRDKKTNDTIEIDGVKLGISIEATTALRLKATGIVSIEGAQVVINGRVVAPSGNPIP